MQIIENKALQIRTRDPSKYRIIPKHHVERIDGGYVVTVHWGLDEVRVLKNLGVKNVPSPIERTYDWPGMYKPFAHQRATAGFATMHRRCFILNEAGTSKTMSALWAADYLMEKGLVRRVLVVAPLSILHAAWMSDLNKSIIHRSAVVAHHASADKRKAMVKGPFEFVIVNFDGLALVADTIKKCGDFDLVIVDECTSYSNPSTRRWKVLNSILRPDTYLWMMTGTPAAQSPMQAFGLAKLVNPSAVPQYVTAWRDRVMVQLTKFKWAPRHDAKAQVHAALQPAIRFTKEQCLDLPPVLTTTREAPMTAQQEKYYRLIRDQQLAVIGNTTVTAVNKAVVIGKLLQVSSGCCRAENDEIVEFDAGPRLQALLEVIEETERKVLVFALHRATILKITEHLKKHDIEAEAIYGDVNATQRGVLVNQFQYSDTPRVLVMQPQTTAHGLTLTRADTVVFFGPLMSVEQYTQCIARADRQGQVGEKVTVVHIQSSPIEKRKFADLMAKVDDHESLTRMFDEEFAQTT